MTPLSDKIESPPGSKADRSERYVAFARAAIAWERIWPALWPATGILGLYLAVALFGLLGAVPASFQALLLFAAIAGIGFALYRNFLSFKTPRWDEAARRVERDSALAHRPITERNDSLAAGQGDPLAEELWRAHLLRMLNGIARLRIAMPAPGLPGRDPYALRYVVLLLVVTGFVTAGGDWNRRLALAFIPGDNGNVSAAMLDAWINPPAYTGEAPLYLQRGSGAPIAVPAGSELVLRVHSAVSRPLLSLYPVPNGTTSEFRGAADEYGANAKLTSDTDVHVREAGQLIGRWHIKAIADEPPQIAFAEPPGKTERDAVKIAFTAGDDYGVVSARALIKPVRAKSGATLAVDLPLSSSSAKTLRETVYRDLTGEPFAGLEVEIVLEAKDGAGQTGHSKPVRFVLPARIFTNPLGRALIEQRQNLAIAEPRARAHAVDVLDALTIAPEHFFQNQSNVYLAVRAAYWGLATARHPDDIKRVQDLLWQTAVGLESGGALAAAEQLRQLQQLISQALAQGAPQSVIEALLERYRQALQRYLQALAENAQHSNAAPPAGAKMLKPEDLEAMLKAIQQMAQTGARGQAAQMMAMLQSLLENLHMQNGAGKGGPDSKALSDAIQGLGDLMGRQRQLLDKTFRENQGTGDPKDGGAKGLSEQQGKLRDDLDKITKGLGAQKLPQPDTLGQAGREMGNAQGQLGSRAFDNAGDAEKNALDAMRQGSSLLAQELMKRNGQGSSQGNGQGNEDPLGRQQGARGGGDGPNMKLPDQSELARARSILEELRKRAAEQGRPKQELDYIDRLLREF